MARKFHILSADSQHIIGKSIQHRFSDDISEAGWRVVVRASVYTGRLFKGTTSRDFSVLVLCLLRIKQFLLIRLAGLRIRIRIILQDSDRDPKVFHWIRILP